MLCIACTLGSEWTVYFAMFVTVEGGLSTLWSISQEAGHYCQPDESLEV